VLPNFIVIGAMKAGTASLYEYLRHHPQVFMSEPKELDYFVEELNWERGVAWYEHYFEDADGAVAVGEGSTSYSKFPMYRGVPSRIADLLPGIRLVYVVRQPVDRMRSQYLHEVALGNEHRPIEQALMSDSTYLAFSRYADQIERYLEYFSSGQLLVITSERLRADRQRTMDRVFRFLGVEGISPEEILNHEFHRTADKVGLRPFFRWAHRLPGYGTLARLVPESVKEATLRFRTRGVEPAHAEISDRLRRHIEDSLQDDIERLRGYIGDEVLRWGIPGGRQAPVDSS
jgi:hypothetical protein